MTPIQINAKALYTCIAAAGYPTPCSYQEACAWRDRTYVNKLAVMTEVLRLNGMPLSDAVYNDAMARASAADAMLQARAEATTGDENS